MRHSKILDLIEMAIQYCPASIREKAALRDFVKLRNWGRFKANFSSPLEIIEFISSLRLDAMKLMSITLSILKLIRDMKK